MSQYMQSGRFCGMPLTQRISVWAILLTLLHVIILPAVALSQEPTSPPPLIKLRLQLKWRHQFQFAGYYAAIEKGYFRNEGLEVELIEGRPGLSPTEELLRNKVDFAVETPAVLIRRQQGMPLVAVAASRSKR